MKNLTACGGEGKSLQLRHALGFDEFIQGVVEAKFHETFVRGVSRQAEG